MGTQTLFKRIELTKGISVSQSVDTTAKEFDRHGFYLRRGLADSVELRLQQQPRIKPSHADELINAHASLHEGVTGKRRHLTIGPRRVRWPHEGAPDFGWSLIHLPRRGKSGPQARITTWLDLFGGRLLFSLRNPSALPTARPPHRPSRTLKMLSTTLEPAKEYECASPTSRAVLCCH